LLQHKISHPEAIPEDFRVVTAGNQRDMHIFSQLLKVFRKEQGHFFTICGHI
jgi:predicted ATP-dependent protease